MIFLNKDQRDHLWDVSDAFQKLEKRPSIEDR